MLSVVQQLVLIALKCAIICLAHKLGPLDPSGFPRLYCQIIVGWEEIFYSADRGNVCICWGRVLFGGSKWVSTNNLPKLIELIRLCQSFLLRCRIQFKRCYLYLEFFIVISFLINQSICTGSGPWYFLRWSIPWTILVSLNFLHQLSNYLSSPYQSSQFFA